MHKILVKASVLGAMAAALAGCGQRGPLYLPAAKLPAPAASAAPSAPVPAPAASQAQP